ncbi:MAG TPA: hypothetical protein PLL28_00685 [Chitinophagales bacterium]|nr:hypothetical protein [Chitinophagales bacterium]HNF67853.1 hypothetical protein [Chitinophagales bacterium]
MDKGDFIQVLLVASVFMVIILLIYSFLNWPVWVSLLLTVISAIGAYLAGRLIKL